MASGRNWTLYTGSTSNLESRVWNTGRESFRASPTRTTAFVWSGSRNTP
ncbi:hypothetical protein ACFPIF_13025 [Brevundimonas faecalis]